MLSFQGRHPAKSVRAHLAQYEHHQFEYICSAPDVYLIQQIAFANPRKVFGIRPGNSGHSLRPFDFFTPQLADLIQNYNVKGQSSLFWRWFASGRAVRAGATTAIILSDIFDVFLQFKEKRRICGGGWKCVTFSLHTIKKTSQVITIYTAWYIVHAYSIITDISVAVELFFFMVSLWPLEGTVFTCLNAD